MANVKQSSGHKRSWFDRLAQLVCITAILTLIAASIAGILGRRLNNLLVTQQAAVKAEQHQQDETLSASLEAARSKWNQKQVGLEKALQSAQLKIKATQSSNTKIREQLVALQKELASLKRSGSNRVTEAVDSGQIATVETAAQAVATESKPPAAVGQQNEPAADGPAVPATAPAATSLPETIKPAGTASAAVIPASGDMAKEVATESVAKQNTSAMAPPKSSLLAVPDADPVASE
jgi:hypothetical protein